MGQVYLAKTTGLGGFERQVVVKTLEPESSDEDSLVTMFLDEARLLGTLHHQYIAPIYEVGCDEEGRYFLVMDYVRGETAEAVWRTAGERDKALPLAFSLSTVSAIASALDYAHSLCGSDGTPLAIVHRDVSLSNVMIGYEGAVKLIDFGIAKFKSRTTHTQVGSLKGKLGYLAPEQILHKHVDHRADLFALGVVLYELTTMTRAFRDNSELITLERIVRGDLALPSSVVRGYPPELEKIVMRALAVDPEERFPSAGAFERELEALAAAMHVQLGHPPLVEVMTSLFDAGRRKRLARSSTEVATDQLRGGPGTAHADEDVTPVVPIDVIEDTDPRMPAEIHDMPTMPVESAIVQPIVRMKRPTTVTAQISLARPRLGSGGTSLVAAPSPSFIGWYLLAALIVIAIAIATAVAYS